MQFFSLVGLLVLLGLAWLMSYHRSRVRIRTVVWGLGLQFVFALIILRQDVWSFVGMGLLAALVVTYLMHDARAGELSKLLWSVMVLLGAGIVGAAAGLLLPRALGWLVSVAPIAFADAIMYESPGNLLYLGPLTVLVAVWSVRRGRALMGVSLVAGYLLQRPLVLLGWMWWDRARPELVAGGVASPGFHSFSSGHAALATFV